MPDNVDLCERLREDCVPNGLPSQRWMKSPDTQRAERKEAARAIETLQSELEAALAELQQVRNGVDMAETAANIWDTTPNATPQQSSASQQEEIR